jgi:hypothetical protein
LIEVTVSGRISFPVSAVQSRTISQSILVTLFGITKSPVNPAHPSKAKPLISFTQLGIFKLPVKPQLTKPDSGIISRLFESCN